MEVVYIIIGVIPLLELNLFQYQAGSSLIPVELAVVSLSKLLKIERYILNVLEYTSDERTNSIMSDFIAEQDFLLWMLKFYFTQKNSY